MSLSAERSMQIDVNSSGITNAVAVQGDHIGRKIKITFLSQGEVIDLSNCTATVKCSANGKTIAVNACNISDNVVTVELTKTMLAYSGKVKMQVSVTDSGGAIISSPIIYLIVAESISTTPVEDTPDFSILADLTGRIMAVLNDPAVGDTEVKDARGGYTVLGDRLNSTDTLAAFPNHTDNLIKNHINFSDTSGWDTVNTGTLTAGSTLLKAVSETNLIIYGALEKTISLNASANILVKIRARCTSGGTATIKPVWRKTINGMYVTSDYIAAGNIDTTSGSWTVGSAFTDMWLIAKDGSAATTINQVGIAISSGSTVEIAHFEVYYSQDKGLTSGELEALKSDVTQNKSDIDDLQTDVNGTKDSAGLKTRMNSAEGNITALQGVVNGSADTTGTVKNQIAAAKADVINNSVNPLAERVTAAENNISANTSNITANASAIADLQAYVGYNNDNILGLQVDYANKTFTRLAGAAELTPGRDFDRFEMFGGRKRCNVLDDGTITAYFGDENYAENGSNGQVMVYQPKFYYKVVPLNLDKNTDSGIGYHIRKANYYVSATPHAGFKLHPAFFDSNGNEVDYILYSAYEGCLYSNHHYVNDNAETSAETDLATDLICSLAGRKPISGLYKPMTRANLETLCKNRGTGWHLETIKSVAANQLLMIVEYATMNLQGAIGQGVVSILDNSSYNCSSFTGSTSALGNATGEAAETVNEINGTKTTYTTSGKTAVSYRGIENPWGNMWRFVNGINVYGDGTMSGGQACISGDFDFSDAVTGNYKKSGFTLPTASGYTNALGYSGDDFDWLLLSSESGGTSALPVGDFTWVAANLNDTRTLQIGGGWKIGAQAGPFCCRANYTATNATREYGGRLLYVPTARI